jgi:hypothetical protein
VIPDRAQLRFRDRFIQVSIVASRLQSGRGSPHTSSKGSHNSASRSVVVH